MFGVSWSTVVSFARRGIILYGPTNVTIALVVLVILFVIKLLGLANPGNFFQKKPDKNESSPLKGKHIIFLGSSVTKGFTSYGKSFVDFLAQRTGALCLKAAVTGTTLADNGSKSYVSRLKALDPKTPCDLFVCQLSTNDATKKVPLGSVASGKDMGSFDTKTVCGAIEYIIAYAKQTWNCPVVFYTNPQYPSVHYQAMVELLRAVAKKWGIQIIDLWSNKQINEKYNRGTYKNDKIHPTRKGYLAWEPVFETALCNVLEGKPIREETVSEPSKKDMRRKQSLWKAKAWVLRIAVVALAVGLGLGYSGWQTLSNTTGIGKPGNSDRYNPENIEPYENSPLQGRTILFLGSSVTQGYASDGISFVDYIERLDGANVIKEVMGATTVANSNVGYASAENSYNPRLRQYDSSTPVEAVVIQLSSNDSTSGVPLGDLSESFDLDQIDDTTFTGGLESLIGYAQETWDCPVVVYSDPQFRGRHFYNAEAYGEMVDKTIEICDKWDAYFLDMWNDPEVNSISNSDYYFYMSDVVHPTKAGYLEWWTPAFQEALYAYFE